METNLMNQGIMPERKPGYEVIMAQNIACDLCGRNGKRTIYKTQSCAYLCVNCHDYLDASGGDIRDYIERWLIGNIM